LNAPEGVSAVDFAASAETVFTPVYEVTNPDRITWRFGRELKNWPANSTG